VGLKSLFKAATKVGCCDRRAEALPIRDLLEALPQRSP
jgi:hypothetical protein